MNITFKGHSTKFLKLEYKDTASNDNDGQMKHFQFGTGFSDSHNSYAIIFNLTLVTDCNHEIVVEFHAFFETDEEIDDEKKESKFILINSPAIAYPYLRAYVSNICLLSGYHPVILPTINFQKIYNDNQERQ